MNNLSFWAALPQWNAGKTGRLMRAACLCCLYLLAACGGGEEPPAAQRPVVKAGTPVADGDRIIFGSLGEASNLIPYLTSDAPSHEVADLLYISPLRYDKNLEIEPYAAESFAVLDDGRRLRFTLRNGMRWEDGEEVTAEDMHFTWKVVCDPATGSPYAQDFQMVKEFRLLDRYSFEVTYEQYFARAVASWMNPILPKHILEGQNIRSTPFARKPVGAGPYRLKAWESGSRITLAASPTYFEGRPHIDEVVYRIIPDVSTTFLEAKAGKLDVVGLTPQQYLRQTDTPYWRREFNKYEYLGSLYVFLGFNLEHPVLQDVRVRRAISQGFSREDLVKGVLMGQGVPAFGPFKPGSWAYHPALQPPRRDVPAARALLAEAGWTDTDGDGIVDKNGRPLAFTILTNQGNEQRILTATVIQAQLRDIGVAVQVRTVEWAAFIREFVDKGRFDAIILGWTLPPDPDCYSVWHSSQARAGGLNMIHYRNAEVDKLLEDARSTPDQDTRAALYRRFQEVLAQEQPYCFLYVPYSQSAVQARFQGIAPALAGIMHNFDTWWVPKDLQKYTVTP